MSENTAALLPPESGLQDGAPIQTSTMRARTGSDSSIKVNDLPMAASPPLASQHEAPSSNPATKISLTLHGDLRSIETEWKQFEQHADCAAFQHYVWLTKFHEHIGSRRGTRPAIVFGRDARGHLVFVLPLAIEAHGPFHCLTWLGSELCDYNMPILAEDFAQAVPAERFASLWSDTLRLLRNDPRFRFDWIDLQKMPEAVGNQKNPFAGLDV